MNPVTDHILSQLREQGQLDEQVEEFVTHWDALESLIVRVYRAGSVPMGAGREWRRVRTWLTDVYDHYRSALEPYWRTSRVKGEVAITEDPFAGLLEVNKARGFIRNWDAMRLLPAARQALNEWLVDQLNESENERASTE